MSNCKTIAVCNQKGGVGKTTLSAALAVRAAQLGQGCGVEQPTVADDADPVAQPLDLAENVAGQQDRPAVRLLAAEQAGHHRTQAVGRHRGQRQADLGAGGSGRQGLGQVANQQAPGGVGLDPGQAIGMRGQLVARGGPGFGGDDAAPQRRLEELQRRLRVGQAHAQRRQGALLHGRRREALVAVVHQRLVDAQHQRSRRLAGRQHRLPVLGMVAPHALDPPGRVVVAGLPVGIHLGHQVGLLAQKPAQAGVDHARLRSHAAHRAGRRHGLIDHGMYRIGARFHPIDGDQQQGFADEQREPHDRRRADSESGEEDRQDRADTGSGDVDGGQACGEEPDLGPHPFHRVPGGLHDPHRELIGHLQQQRGERDDQERPEHALGEPEGGAGQRGFGGFSGGDVADVSEAMLGLWKDSAGDIYGFYKDNSFFGQWKDEEQDVLGVYALSSDGEYTALVMQFANDDGTYDDENMVTYLVQANEEENLLELYDPDSLDLTATLEPYEADGDESDYNQTYQDMGDILTECYSGETEAGETFIYAANEDGTFCSVLVIDQDDNYVSFVGEGTFDEENGTVTITDEVSEMALTFGVAVNDDDTLTLDMGDLGSATVEEATLAVAVQGLKYAVENGTEMN